ncbi:uncharacterized protein BYT42DRAFT_629005 [Radiomyces spectabilis]|uniref:uncharacterized protein n=1 Tax=Radiomyces spectabilis TaxID=64574 RepID=UPI00222127B2|nr:uncharacterized protein BYT42DRAFT_629005 [Radiomyces spectabilis]KAI8391417.1 hypothetical protein BYT42DRAFT_629005 [Radiomyces spectabilis]
MAMVVARHLICLVSLVTVLAIMEGVQVIGAYYSWQAKEPLSASSVMSVLPIVELPALYDTASDNDVSSSATLSPQEPIKLTGVLYDSVRKDGSPEEPKSAEHEDEVAIVPLVATDDYSELETTDRIGIPYSFPSDLWDETDLPTSVRTALTPLSHSLDGTKLLNAVSPSTLSTATIASTQSANGVLKHKIQQLFHNHKSILAEKPKQDTAQETIVKRRKLASSWRFKKAPKRIEPLANRRKKSFDELTIVVEPTKSFGMKTQLKKSPIAKKLFAK